MTPHIAAFLYLVYSSMVLTARSKLDPPSSLTDDNSYQIIPFETTSGVYFEYMDVVRRSVSNWRIAVFLDIGTQCRFFDDLKSRLRRLKTQCGPDENWCEELVQNYEWEDRWEMASELQKQFRTQIEELENTKTTLPG